MWKPQRIVAGESVTHHRNIINRLGLIKQIEVHFSDEKTRIVRLSKDKLPSTAIVGLSSSKYDAFECCHDLEWHPDITVYCLYPDNRKDLLNEAYGWGFDISSEYSQLEEHLAKYLDADYDSDHMPAKLRKWNGTEAWNRRLLSKR